MSRPQSLTGKPVFPYRVMERILLTGAGGLAVGSLLLQGQILSGLGMALVSLLAFRVLTRSRLMAALLVGGVSTVVAWSLISQVDQPEMVSAGFWCQVVAAWLLAWACVEQLSSIHTLSSLYRSILGVIIPVLFGVWLLILWELLTRGLDVPQVLLPSPSQIGERLMNSTSILWADFKQTFLKAVLIGYAVGCGAGFVVAVLIDRSPFLQRGLLPIGNLVSALPIVGVAPIMVMWFGFDWPSKAAVVIIMTFFPMLVNTVAGLAAAQPMQHDLMKTYAASYWQSLFKLRIPEALPFLFNALKINSTLAMIGAIVAEFFGTPTVGMGFRISTEVGRMNVDMVWAEIAVAALAGSMFYGLIALLERMFTFWHPSVRS
ncbi:ABC transporter permease [Granulosicoccus antarcticus]|uniref:Aliphatic sulfonates transport permease protein SsuC n=1 Tax=Granulosicoccus antarcticus IMCC3135 TaxID=1192854 RepID=A0A2Z2NP73_9GAMM|nr:ABC transporter permease [Granulosicoccus antarcticus]ASJ71731.1 Putative aliphatic sulfonates transport permease protein SsuC [Granulosicoccus antarcticus IMCC3135]